jgi:tRNA A37 threonylcarbamoyladenosine dehydratase
MNDMLKPFWGGAGNDWRTRTRMLIGAEGVEKLQNASIIVFGAGGVGGFCVESLVRSGVGRLCIVDFDTVDITNLNRQIIALHSTLGQPKARIAAARAKDINPQIEITALEEKLEQNNIGRFSLSQYDYIIDAIDDVDAKLLLIAEAKRIGVPVISSMGTGNKTDPSKFRVTDIAKTHTCPLAKIIRRELGKQNITDVKVLFSTEKPEKAENIPGVASISYNPAVAGLMLSAEVIRDILACDEK